MTLPIIGIPKVPQPPERFLDLDRLAFYANWTLKHHNWPSKKEDLKMPSYTKKGPGRKHRQGSGTKIEYYQMPAGHQGVYGQVVDNTTDYLLGVTR